MKQRNPASSLGYRLYVSFRPTFKIRYIRLRFYYMYY
jgi:hypothetical protein